MTLHGLNLLHSNNSISILHTDLFIFPMELTRRICYTINSFFNWRSFPLEASQDLNVWFSRDTVERN